MGLTAAKRDNCICTIIQLHTCAAELLVDLLLCVNVVFIPCLIAGAPLARRPSMTIQIIKFTTRVPCVGMHTHPQPRTRISSANPGHQRTLHAATRWPILWTPPQPLRPTASFAPGRRSRPYKKDGTDAINSADVLNGAFFTLYTHCRHACACIRVYIFVCMNLIVRFMHTPPSRVYRNFHGNTYLYQQRPTEFTILHVKRRERSERVY